MEHVAWFREDDPGALVAASLSCPVCLGADVDWSLEVAEYDPSVVCACRSCGHRRRLFLDGGQALRLALAGDRGRW